MGPTPVLSRFRLVSSGRVLLEHPIYIAEVLLGPRKYHSLENVASVDFLVDFDSLIHENEGGLTASADSAPDHDGLRILAVFSSEQLLSFCWLCACSTVISLDSLPDDLAVGGRVDGASSTTSWTATIVAELLETIDGLGHSLLRHIKQANNITLTHSFTKQLQNCTTFI